MSEVAQNAQHEFWRPPVVPQVAASAAEACAGCGSEFMVSAGYCHVCGRSRRADGAFTAESGWARYLELNTLSQAFGLATASLVAFFLGLGCLLAALAVSVIYSVQSLADFQAVQSYRTQWLLAAVAAFVVGILLKKTPAQKN